MLWEDPTKIHVTSFARNFINLEVDEGDRGKWRLTGFYGYVQNLLEEESPGILLAALFDLSWCIIGDFNDLLSQEEKRGRVERPQWLIDGFRNTVLDCNLTDIPLEGYPFTWAKSRLFE